MAALATLEQYDQWFGSAQLSSAENQLAVSNYHLSSTILINVFNKPRCYCGSKVSAAVEIETNKDC